MHTAFRLPLFGRFKPKQLYSSQETLKKELLQGLAKGSGAKSTLQKKEQLTGLQKSEDILLNVNTINMEALCALYLGSLLIYSGKAAKPHRVQETLTAPCAFAIINVLLRSAPAS